MTDTKSSTTNNTTAKADTKKIETTKVEAKKIATTKTEAKKIATAKTESKKIATSKTDAKKLSTAKKDVKKIETTKAEPVMRRIATKKNSGNANIYVQFAGSEYNVSAVVKNIEDRVSSTDNLDIYIKPEDGKAYFVSEDQTGSVEL